MSVLITDVIKLLHIWLCVQTNKVVKSKTKWNSCIVLSHQNIDFFSEDCEKGY